ncbi:MAG TPA: matrixin family metalloprotease, partial [Polyangiales bacterium]|nr:matrixin family metalloprotease [Polyangiales bacterium]
MGALAFVLVWLLWLGPLVPASAAWCRASVETSPLGDCEEVADVALLRWTRGCVRYGFHRDLFERLPLLRERQIRTDAEAAFAAYREVDCGRSPFDVQALPAVSGADRAEFNWDVENESLIAARSSEEWTALEYDENAIALTLLFFDPDSGEIYDADMELNAGIGELTHCDQRCSAGQVDLPSTLIHEAGHYLGLGHSTVQGSTMSSHADVGTLDKRTLEDDDRDGYCALELPEPEQDPGDQA